MIRYAEKINCNASFVHRDGHCVDVSAVQSAHDAPDMEDGAFWLSYDKDGCEQFIRMYGPKPFSVRLSTSKPLIVGDRGIVEFGGNRWGVDVVDVLEDGSALTTVVNLVPA